MTALAPYLALLAALATVTALKGKWGVFVLGLALWPAWLLGAIRLAKPDSRWARRFYSAEKREHARAVLPRRVLMARAAAVPSLALFVAALSTVKLYRIPSSAMEPTVHCPRPARGCEAETADRVLALRFLAGGKPGRGDVVAIRIPARGAERCGGPTDSVHVHRVIGLPGERIEARSGAIYINDERLSQLYAPKSRSGSLSFPPQRIPDSHYFVLGDNRPASCDSHVWGPLPEDRLVALVVAIYWPPERAGLL